MSDPWGFDLSQQRPSQLSAWSKMKLGWLEPHQPDGGLNRISYAEDSSNFPQLYKIGDGEFNFPPNEYLLIEYRTKTGMDVDLPGEGLLIYHIDFLYHQSQVISFILSLFDRIHYQIRDSHSNQFIDDLFKLL